MIVRFVKMTFRPEATAEFEQVFNHAQPQIAAFEGCKHVELLKDEALGNVYFTRSIWESDANLQLYRQSDLFKATWAATSALFADKPEAWSLTHIA